MKTILIIGDSWGVPNYNEEWSTSPETHTEYRLKKLGYDVLNFSLNGSSATETIDYAKHTLKNTLNPNSHSVTVKRQLSYNIKPESLKEIPVPNYNGQKIDWVVWFHTEPIRHFDCSHDSLIPYLTCEEAHQVGCKIAYRAFVKLIDIIGKHVKTAIIGGQAPIDPSLYEYHKPNFIIEDWRSEIVGKKLPTCYTFSRTDLVDQSYDTLDKKLEILNVHKIVLNSMSDLSLFFDRCHPGEIPHELLTKKLHQAFIDV
jgi:hypothetical protein